MAAEQAKYKGNADPESTAKQSCSEATPLRQRDSLVLSGKPQAAVLGGLCVAYAFCILPVGLSAGLLPALEEDPVLGWSPLTSGLYMGATMWAVAFGSLTIGWVSDYFPNTLVLLLYVFIAGVLLDAMSFVHTAAAFITLHMMVYVLKSVTWPAAMSIIGTHLANMKPEFGILLVGLFSRLSVVGSSLLIGSLLLHLSWRSALQAVAAVCVCSVVMFRLLIKFAKMDHLLEMPAAMAVAARPSPASAAAPAPGAEPAQASGEAVEAAGPPSAQQASSFADMWAYCLDLFKDQSFLLLILFAVGLELSLGLMLFVSAFMHSIYSTSVAESAIYSGTMNMGEVGSLCVGILLVAMGMRRSTLYKVILAQLAMGMLVSLSIIFFEVSFQVFFVFGTLLGFATTLGGYLIVPVHCIELAKAKSLGDIATRVTIVDGLAMLVGATTRFFVGLERNVDEKRGLLLSAILAFIGTSAMAFSCYCLFRKSSDSPSVDDSHSD